MRSLFDLISGFLIHREAVQLCQSTLEISEDYRIWNELGRSEESLGVVAKARQ